MLRLEELLRLPRPAEHRERERRLTAAEVDHAGGEDRELVGRRPRQHVDHAAALVRPDLEEELPEAVDDLVPAVDDLQLAGELGRPARDVLDVGEVGEDAIGGGAEDGGDCSGLHRSITPFRTVRVASRSAGDSCERTWRSSPSSTSAATGRKARLRSVSQTRYALPSSGSRTRRTRPAASMSRTSVVIVCLESRARTASAPIRNPSSSKSGSSTDPYAGRTSA